MSDVKILILGGRFGGLQTAYDLKRYLKNKADIKIIEKNRYIYFRPALPHVGIGLERAEDLRIDLAQVLPDRGIGYIQGTVTKIDPEKNLVEYSREGSGGYKEKYDFLVVALGSHLASEMIAGFDKYGSSVCEADLAENMWKKLKDFKGGNITLGSAKFIQDTKNRPTSTPDRYAPIADSACEGPVFEMSIMLYDYFKAKNMLDKVKMTVYSPGEYLSDLSRTSRTTVAAMYKGMNIELVDNFVLKEVTEKEVISEDGRRLPSDISFILPPYTGQKLVKDAGLGDDVGFVLTDTDMKSVKYDNVYAVGDVNALIVPKMAFLAVKTARIVAANIANRMGMSVPVEIYDPKIVCVADSPYGNYAVAVADSTFYGGNLSEAVPSPANHLKKTLFTRYFLWSKGDLAMDKYLTSW
ncbi:NAD(P)/FAD-dependent oxidoreductase [Thermoplasma sp.]|uniref:NAD(P)/FAD-dependent oxidoreductase n=1 Tax=Thermoplasma sp. TaxID=1973142 RepID=UPI00126A9F74|nr:FAD/NAD(P)-binding oxidoreductase [Thermoplasma sp.]KAA8922292.1 MAG: NAD(P)/FAD-dependent oxidoreductase [Thermoplasma sp.]